MNTIGTLGAAFANWLTGTLVERSLAARAATLQIAVDELSTADKRSSALAGYQTVFFTYALAYVIAAVCWTLLRPRHREISGSRPSGDGVSGA